MDSALPHPSTDDGGSTTFGLLARLRAGDRAAADQLFAMHYAPVSQAVRLNFPAALRVRLAEEDILQETMLKAVRALDRFDYAGEGTFRAWLVTIVVNAIRDALRSQRRRPEVAMDVEDGTANGGVQIADDTGTTPPGHAMRREQQHRLERALDALDAMDRALLVDRMILGLSPDEMVHKHGKSTGALRMAILRARARLAEQFDGPTA